MIHCRIQTNPSANQWNTFNININKEYKISKISIDKKTPFDNDLSPEILFAFFTELSESSIDKFESNIQFLNLLYQFSLELIKKHAILPEFFRAGDKYHIRWIPAVFDKTISDLINGLAFKCPDNLLKFKNRKISKKDQIIIIITK